jgi:hypothetical protein
MPGFTCFQRGCGSTTDQSTNKILQQDNLHRSAAAEFSEKNHHLGFISAFIDAGAVNVSTSL